MRKLIGIVTQITLLVILVTIASVYLLSQWMSESARDVVIDHEIVDLDEETQLQGWRLLHDIQKFRDNLRQNASLLRRATRGAEMMAEEGNRPPVLDADELRQALSDNLRVDCICVEVVPFDETTSEPDAGLLAQVGGRCMEVNAATYDVSESRTALLEQFRRKRWHNEQQKEQRGERRWTVVLSDAIFREKVPFRLTEAAMKARETPDKEDSVQASYLWQNNYHVLWGAIRVPDPKMENSEPDENEDTDWILLMALGLDEALRGIAGSARHLGFVYDHNETLYLHPTRNAELSQATPKAQIRIDDSHYILQPSVLDKDKFVEARLASSHLVIGKKDENFHQPRMLQSGMHNAEFIYCETRELGLDQEQMAVAQQVLWRINNEYLDKEWSGSFNGVRRVSPEGVQRMRIRMLASSRDLLGEVKEHVEREINQKLDGGGLPTIPGKLRWLTDPIACRSCLASQVRVVLPRSPEDDTNELDEAGEAKERPSITEEDEPSLTIVRAVFAEELAADLEEELGLIRNKAVWGASIAVAVAFVVSLVITRPLTKVTRAARSLAATVRGGAVQPAAWQSHLRRLPTRRPDEIGDLARAFCDLVSQVEGYAVKIRERESFLKGIHDTAMDGIVTIGEDGKIRSFNPAAEQIFGRSVEEVVGHDFGVLYSKSTAEQLQGFLENYLNGGAPQMLGKRTELQGRRKGGQKFPLEVSVSEVTLADGRRVFTSLMRDLTDAKMARTAQGLRVANQDKARALREIAHEMISDLTAISGSVDLYIRQFGAELNEKQRQFLGRIESSAKSLIDFVRDLRDVARIDRGNVELNFEDLSPAEVIGDVVALLQPQFDAKDHVLTVDTQAVPRLIQADKNRFRQIIGNLLSNACKYTPRGGAVTIRAEIAGAGDDSHLHLEVEDNGIGIPDEDREKVLEDFGRASNADEQATGQGMGLALCRRLVELHWGTLDFTSTRNVGTTFWVDLPLRAQRLRSDDESAELFPVVQGRRVIVADHDSARRSELGNILQEAGHTFIPAEDAEALIGQVRAAPPDVIITTMRLGNLTAVEAVAEIRKLGGCGKLPVVLMVRADITDVESFGFTRCLKLPVRRGTLLSMLGEIRDKHGSSTS